MALSQAEYLDEVARFQELEKQYEKIQKEQDAVDRQLLSHGLGTAAKTALRAARTGSRSTDSTQEKSDKLTRKQWELEAQMEESRKRLENYQGV